DFIEMADEALKTKVKAVDQVAAWEDPLATLNSFLADSETLVAHHAPLKKVRDEVRARKMELQKRIQDVVQAGRAPSRGDALRRRARLARPRRGRRSFPRGAPRDGRAARAPGGPQGQRRGARALPRRRRAGPQQR